MSMPGQPPLCRDSREFCFSIKVTEDAELIFSQDDSFMAAYTAREVFIYDLRAEKGNPNLAQDGGRVNPLEND